MCDLALLGPLTTYAPTSASGFGYVEFRYSTTNQGHVVLTVSGPQQRTVTYIDHVSVDHAPQGSGQLYNLPVGTYDYSLSLETEPGCPALTGTFTIGAPAQAVDPSLTDPPRWQPVGGVLPNPIPLLIEATLLSAGAPRAGLYAEVELYRPGATQPLASFRATVREASQTVDAAPYLRAQLRAALSYTPTAPLIDPEASLRFTYRYRIGDRQTVEGWRTRAGERYAVLAALGLANDTMAPYLADAQGGRVASIFPPGEAVQFVGCPLEVSVLLPPPPANAAPRWVEYRYLSAAGQEVEIRSVLLDPALGAGMLRIPLPQDPPLRAASVEVAIVDSDRHYQGQGGHVVPPVPASTQGTYADPLYGFY